MGGLYSELFGFVLFVDRHMIWLFSCVDCDDMVENFFWILPGIGQPTFSSEDSCTYVFDWETQYACIEKPASCQLLTGRHLFDLSLLMRTNKMGQTMFVHICSMQITSSSSQKDLQILKLMCMVNVLKYTVRKKPKWDWLYLYLPLLGCYMRWLHSL